MSSEKKNKKNIVGVSDPTYSSSFFAAFNFSSSPPRPSLAAVGISLLVALVAATYTLTSSKMRLHEFWSLTATLLLLAPSPSMLSPAHALNITINQPGRPFAPSPLPAPHASSDGGKIVSLFQNLGRTTTWKLVEKVKFEGNTYEPEGILRLGPDRYIVSAGEYTVATESYGNNTVINGTDRTAGAGFAHLIVFSGNGTRIADATLTVPGAIEYHNGGIDFDGSHIWATIAQYRPNSTATVVKVDPHTLEPTDVLHYDDHLGGIVHDPATNLLTTLNWGARNASIFNLSSPALLSPSTSNSSSDTVPPRPPSAVPTVSALSVARNPTYFVDYQDCKFLGHHQAHHTRSFLLPASSSPNPNTTYPLMLCIGVATLSNPTNASAPAYNLGGLAIVDALSMAPLAEVPFTGTSDLGVSLAQNPVDVAVSDRGLLTVYVLPDQHNSTLYVYEAQVESEYEF